MFDPIKGPPNEFLPPATGHGTEFGDSWHTAVAKINASFAKIRDALMRGVAISTDAVDEELRKSTFILAEAHRDMLQQVQRLEGVLSDALFKLDALEARVNAM